jgi:hypothetical protein
LRKKFTHYYTEKTLSSKHGGYIGPNISHYIDFRHMIEMMLSNDRRGVYI